MFTIVCPYEEAHRCLAKTPLRVYAYTITGRVSNGNSIRASYTYAVTCFIYGNYGRLVSGLRTLLFISFKFMVHM